MKKITLIPLTSAFLTLVGSCVAMDPPQGEPYLRDYIPPNFESFSEGQRNAFFSKAIKETQKYESVIMKKRLENYVSQFYETVKKLSDLLIIDDSNVDLKKVSSEFNYQKCALYDFVFEIQNFHPPLNVHDVLSKECEFLAPQSIENYEDIKIVKNMITPIISREIIVRKSIADIISNLN